MGTLENETEIVLQQWKTCVEMANSISQRRDTMNNIFVTLNLAIVAAISLTCDTKSLLVSIAGITLCTVWFFFIRNYKLLNKEKFIVINSIEEKLPIKPFNEEWENLKQNRKYFDCTIIEYALPAVFLLMHIATLILIVKEVLL